MSATSILINIGAKTAGAVKEIDKVGDALDRQKTAGEKSKAFFKGMAIPATAAFAAVSAGAIETVKAAEEAAKSQAALDQVFQSMGYKENAKAASDYASELSMLVGIDDEVIKGAQTKLATFDAVAKSQTTMARATAIAADMQAAGFGSMESGSVMLGKALQDPIKGIGALAKVGVTFSDEQKKMIASMVKTGDVAGAQGIIMEALETQVGGVAEASATNSQKMGVAFGEISEAVGGALLPAFESLMPYIMGFAKWATDNSGTLIAIGAVIGGLAATVLIVNGAMAAWSAITAIWTAITTVATAVGTAFGAVMAFITSPVFLVVAAIVALIAIIVLLVKHWDTVSAALGAAWDWIAAKAKDVWGAIASFFVGLWDSIKSAAGAAWDWVVEKVSGAWEGLKGAIKTGVDAIVTFAKELPGKVLSALGSLGSTLLQKGKDLMQGMLDGILAIAGKVWDFYTFLPTKVLGFIGAVGKTLFGKGSDLIGGLFDGIKEKFEAVKEWFGGLKDKVVSAVGGLGSALYQKGKDLINGLVDGIRATAGAIMNAIRAVVPDSLERFVPGLRSAEIRHAWTGYSNVEGRSSGSGSVSTRTATINMYGTADAAVIRRALEGYDVSQGRAAGAPLAVAW